MPGSGCAQRYLAHDALNAIFEATRLADAEDGADYHQRFLAYLHERPGPRISRSASP